MVITVHELGHYFAAKLVGFNIEELSVGIGLSIIKKKKKDIVYSLKCVPIGGYCLIKELDPAFEDASQSVRRLSIKRIIVLVSGPVANLLLVFLLFSASGNILGLPINKIENTCILDQSISEDFMLRHVNGQRVFNTRNIEQLLIPNQVNILTFRDFNNDIAIDVPIFISSHYIPGIVFNDTALLRIASSYAFIKDMVGAVLRYVSNLFVGEAGMFDDFFSNPYSHPHDEDFTNPLSYQLTWFVVTTGSLSYGVFYFNLLPFVVFDGYKIFMYILPAIRNKKTNRGLFWALIGFGIVLSLILIL